MLSLRLRQFKFGFTRFVCFVRIHSDNPVLKCCPYNSNLAWYCENTIDDYIFEVLWGPEMARFIFKFDEYMNAIRNEYEIIQEHTPALGIYHCKIQQRNMDLAILKYLNITEKDLHLFYIEFIEHCFPSVYLTFYSMEKFLENFDLTIPAYLVERFFNTDIRNQFSFEDLLITLTCMDPHCPHIERRFMFIFRYYDNKREGYLNEVELRKMVRDIHRTESQEVIDRKVADYMALKDNSSEGLTYNDFKKGVISGTIEGTDRLFRLKFPLFRRIGCGRKRVGPNVLNVE